MSLLPVDPVVFIAGPPLLIAGAALYGLARRVRAGRELHRDALAALDAEPGTFTEVRPDLFVVAEPRAVVVSLDARRAARHVGRGSAA